MTDRSPSYDELLDREREARMRVEKAPEPAVMAGRPCGCLPVESCHWCSQSPAMSEWEIVGRRAMQECERQITADEYSARRILHILKYGSTS